MSLGQAGWTSRGASGMFALGLLCTSGAAAADDSTPNGSRFGATGAIAFDRILGYSSSAGFGSMFGVSTDKDVYDYGTMGRGTYHRTMTWVSPTIDVFVGHGFSIGVTGGAQHVRRTASGEQGVPPSDETSTRWSFEPRVGYAIPVVDELAFWPRLSIGYTGAWGDGVPEVPMLSLAKGWIGSVSFPVILAPSRHLFFSVGPELEFQVLDGGSESGTPKAVLIERRAVSLQWAGGFGVVL